MNKIKKISLKKNKSKIICLTAYSKNIAEIIDKHSDIILVGDSLGSVLYNYNSTKKVTLINMIEHAQSVRKGVKKSLLIVDMPFNTYNNKKQALKNARSIIKNTKCDGVKLEGGFKIKKIIQHLLKNNIQVMGHLGILPQSTNGKFKSKGKSLIEKNKLMNEARLLEDLGVFAIVLECINSKTAKYITENISIPTIGIGSSINCDGQILVTDDLIVLNDVNMRFVKKFLNTKKYIDNGIRKFKYYVKNKKFPQKKHSY